jgi:hypothetical protein
MEAEAKLIMAREFPSRNPDWFDGGATYTRAYAVRLRAALEDKAEDGDVELRYHPEVVALRRAFHAPEEEKKKVIPGTEAWPKKS